MEAEYLAEQNNGVRQLSLWNKITQKNLGRLFTLFRIIKF